MKKLALVVPSLADGGGVTAVARFVKDAALQSGRYEVKLVSLSVASRDAVSRLATMPSTWRTGPIVRQGEWEGMPFVHVGADWGEFEFQHYMPRPILNDVLSDCDVVQEVCGSPAWANAVVGAGKPVALQVATRAVVERRQRDGAAKDLRGLWRRAMTRITDKLDDRALKRVDAIQVENLWMLEYSQNINEGRSLDLRYAPPGIDASLFTPLSARDIDTRPYILCVGRLNDPRKNIGLLLEAYARLPRATIDRVPLVLAGSSGPGEAFWLRAEILRVAGRVQYIERPSRAALVKLYQQASLFALSSDEEGLGVVILEAMGCGVPVVSTKSGGPDGIIQDGVDGFLVSLGDAAAMSQRMATLLQDKSLNLEIGRRAREVVEARYDEVVAGKEFVNTWDSLVL